MITIGITSSDPTNNFILYDMIESLLEQETTIPYEILVVGGKSSDHNKVRHIPFDETQKPKGWVTRKKNIITTEAKYDTIVYAHDYFWFDKNWFAAWKDFIDTTPFDVAVNKIFNLEQTRHSDWVVDPFLLWEIYPDLYWKYWEVALPYDVNYTKIQYISGNYFVARRSFMEQFPFNEELLWGDAEDIEWSKRIREHTTFQINTLTSVTLQKPGKWHPSLIKDEHLARLLERHYDSINLL